MTMPLTDLQDEILRVFHRLAEKGERPTNEGIAAATGLTYYAVAKTRAELVKGGSWPEGEAKKLPTRRPTKSPSGTASKCNKPAERTVLDYIPRRGDEVITAASAVDAFRAEWKRSTGRRASASEGRPA